MAQVPENDFRCCSEVLDNFRPGCVVRICSRIPGVKDVLGLSEVKKHHIPNGTLAILTELLGTGDAYYIATILSIYGLCIIKACDIAEVVFAGREGRNEKE